MGKTSNQRDAFDRVADFGEEVRSEWTHRDSIGVAIGQGSRHWARGQTHGDSVNSLNLMLGVKRVNGEKINLADDWSSYPFDVRILGRYMEFGMPELIAIGALLITFVTYVASVQYRLGKTETKVETNEKRIDAIQVTMATGNDIKNILDRLDKIDESISKLYDLDRERTK